MASYNPIPLSQLRGDGGGGSGWMMTLLICCISSIISAIIGFVFRKPITKMLSKKGGASAAPVRASAAPVRAAGGGSAVVKARRLKIRGRRRGGRKIRRGRIGRRIKKFGRRKGVRKIGRGIGRRIKKFGRRRAVRKIGRRRAVRKIGRRIRKMRWCFAPETPIKLQNGETRALKDLELGDILINGSIVKATLKIKNESDPYYKLPGDIRVTGSHYVKDGDVYKRVKNFSQAEATTEVGHVLYCLITSDHKIPVGDFIFWDWEDNLIVQ
tara:strand:- start:15527 stop:16333 length:807 start_codon:yes stop_codon:yes gene_type:complete